MTRNRRAELQRSLRNLLLIPDLVVIVVDNASTDGTPEMVRTRFPEVELVELSTNRGSVARDFGVAVADTEFVAFSDDDSWWAPGALENAVELLKQRSRLGLVAARVLVGDEQVPDPLTMSMERPSIGVDSVGLPRVLGFLACGAVVRRQAYLEAGGFEKLIFFYGEEETLALDLAAAGWELVYSPEVVAEHHPDGSTRQPGVRRRREVRNRILSAVIHRPWAEVVRRVRQSLGQGPFDRQVWRGLFEAIGLFPRAVWRRRPVPPWLDQQASRLEGS